jgi:putative nucleotidyltransferase with HDIG domain
MTSPSLTDLDADMDALPPLPTVVQRLIHLLGREEVSRDEVTDVLAEDQSLVARVLRVANSPFYGIQHKVAGIHEAIVVLGFRAVGNLALAASLRGCFTPPPHSGIDPLAFWRHSIGVGAAARVLAGHAALSPEAAFTAGLLHDMGKLVLATLHTDAYVRVLQRAWAEDCSHLAAERHVLGFDHAQVGGRLATRWHFPPAIAEAVAHHHAPCAAPHGTYLDVVHLADILAHALDLGQDVHAQVPPVDAGAWQRLALDAPTLAALLPRIQREYDKLCTLLSG